MSENDAQLELKKRARRRLVGAAALAVLAAVVLPMVMDQAPSQPVEDIQIRIPAQDAGAFTSRILPVKPGSTPTPLPPAVASPEVEPAKPGRDGADATKKAPPEKVSPTGTANTPPQPRATAPVDEKLLAKKPESARDKPAANSNEQWIVQLGAYKDPANVRNLAAKLKQQGYNFYTEVLPSPDGSNRTRVRAGPFPSREAAEAARERIKRIGVNGVVAEKGA